MKSNDKSQNLEVARRTDEIPERFVAASELGIIETELCDFTAARKYLEAASLANSCPGLAPTGSRNRKVSAIWIPPLRC